VPGAPVAPAAAAQAPFGMPFSPQPVGTGAPGPAAPAGNAFGLPAGAERVAAPPFGVAIPFKAPPLGLPQMPKSALPEPGSGWQWEPPGDEFGEEPS
jgi:hypothetical protein